jgi:hypothetical protein
MIRYMPDADSVFQFPFKVEMTRCMAVRPFNVRSVYSSLTDPLTEQSENLPEKSDGAESGRVRN